MPSEYTEKYPGYCTTDILLIAESVGKSQSLNVSTLYFQAAQSVSSTATCILLNVKQVILKTKGYVAPRRAPDKILTFL